MIVIITHSRILFIIIVVCLQVASVHVNVSRQLASSGVAVYHFDTEKRKSA